MKSGWRKMKTVRQGGRKDKRVAAKRSVREGLKACNDKRIIR